MHLIKSLHLKTESQQLEGGNAETSSSHSKKRRREEMEQDCPKEDKQTKKCSSKKVVPSREQSTRYDSLDNYRLH
jgi:hypothetical protein